MKKRFVLVCVVLVVTLAVIYLYRYRRPLNMEGKVPVQATQVVHLNLRQIEHHLLMDVIKSPFEFSSSGKSKMNQDGIGLNDVITIPRNIFFYTNTSTLKNGWFSNKIKVKDVGKLHEYLLKQGFKTETGKQFVKDRIVIGVSANDAIIAYRIADDSIHIVLSNLIDNNDYQNEDDLIVRTLSNATSDITYTSTGGDSLNANFKKGAFEILGELNTDLFLTNEFAVTESSIAAFNTKINKEHRVFKSLFKHLDKEKFREFSKLSMDSIVNKWDGSVVFDLKQIDEKIDTIITYEYDDDFNRIEKQSVQKQLIPNFTLQLGEGEELTEYFYKKNMAKLVEGDTVFVGMPLYKTYFSNSDNRLLLSSQNNSSIRLQGQTSYKLYSHIAVNKYLKTPLEYVDFSNKPFADKINIISITLTVDNKLAVKITLNETEQNFVTTLVE